MTGVAPGGRSPALDHGEQLAAAIDGVVAEFCPESGWAGEFTSLSRFWVAPEGWRLTGEDGAFAARFVFAAATTTGVEIMRDDQRATLALTGASDDPAMLLWERQAVGSAITFAKFVGTQRAVGAQLERLAFVRNGHGGRGYHLPLVIDTVALGRGDAEGAVDPLRTCLRAVRASAPVFEPLIAWVKEALQA